MAIIALLYSLYTQGWKEILKLMDLSSTEKRLTEDEKKHINRRPVALLPSVASVVNRKWSHRDGH